LEPVVEFQNFESISISKADQKKKKQIGFCPKKTPFNVSKSYSVLPWQL
jgi:hypothetical protein